MGWGQGWACGPSFAKLASGLPCPTSHQVLFSCTLPWDQNCPPQLHAHPLQRPGRDGVSPTPALCWLPWRRATPAPALWPLLLITYLLCSQIVSSCAPKCNFRFRGLLLAGVAMAKDACSSRVTEILMVTEVQRAMLPGPGLAAENTTRRSFRPASTPGAAEAGRKGVLWEDCSTTGEEAEAGQGWPSGAGTQGTPAAVSPALLCLSGLPLVTSNVPEGLGLSPSHFQRQSAGAGTKSPRCEDGC